jgi:ABC-2 type transport system permease protein
MKQTLAIARKELSATFGSPMALLFIGAFLVVTLFAFFWVEAFFARNIADVRPLFHWMPVLILFLVAALTMRQWSEEQRAGTLEVLLTLPVRRAHLVLGKFLAVMALVALALGLTLFLPITVSILGDLDWGPVVGGYVAALLMASAYAAIGLFVSSRTDNQIVSLIATVFVGGIFYLLGTTGVTGLVGDAIGEILRAMGTGSRFESIERGVIDLRDLVYYLSQTVIFLALNVASLDAKRWSRGAQTAAYRRQVVLTVVLVVANLVLLNVWLFPLGSLRADLTADQEYSLSPVTVDLVRNLQEPLLVRGYFSEKTHPLLAPLVPGIRDMLREYEIASGGRIQVEVVDPREDEELEVEANQVYGIRPSPFRMADRYESSVINSYFDILVRYGDQHVTLGFGDLIEVEPRAGGDLDVRLRNLEYDLTRAIKKVVYGFQSLDAVFDSIEEPIHLTALITPNTLPAGLEEVPGIVDKVAYELRAESGGKFTYEIVDPDAEGSPITRDVLVNSWGLYPIGLSLFAPESSSYYLHLVLQIGDEAQLLYPSGDLTEAEIRTELESALKRAAPGFLKTVGVWLPDLQPVQGTFGGMVPPISSWNMLLEQLRQTYTVKQVDLTSGRVPGDVDVLLVIAPQAMGDEERFAIDQYLMRGGSVLAVAGNYVLPAEQFPGGLSVEQTVDGLQEMLASYGVDIGAAMVLDPQNQPLPLQVERTVGGMRVIEVQELSYPYFVDVRDDGMAEESPIVSNLPAVTMHWASPLTLDEGKNEGREVTVLLESTEDSWLRSATDVQPDPDLYPLHGFPLEGDQQAWPLAVAIRGSFDSYFKDRASPFEAGQGVTETIDAPLGTVEVSPESARLVVIGCNEFIDDPILDMSRSLSADRYLHNLTFVQNAVDWSVEDEDLLTIRSGGTYARLLKPLEKGQQSLWEGLNYGVALLALVAIGGVWYLRRRSEEPMGLDVTGLESEREEPSGTEPPTSDLEPRTSKLEPRTLTILLAGLLVVQLVVAAVVLWPRPAVSGEGEALFAGLEASRVVGLTISDSGGETVELARRDGAWVLPAASDYPVLEDRVPPLLDKIVALDTDRMVTQTRGSHSRLKVAEDEFERLVELTLDDSTRIRLYIGSSPSFGATHVRADGQDEVYLTSELTAQDAGVEPTLWVERTYFSVPRDEVVALTLENANGRFRFIKSGEAWAMEGLAPDETLSDAAVQTLLSRATSVAMTRPLGKEEQDAYGMEEPAAVAVLESHSDEAGDMTYTLSVGAQDPEDNSFVVLSSESPYYVRVAEFSVQDLVEKARDDFLELPPTPTPEAEPTPTG